MSDLFRLESIAQIHQLLGLAPPSHPLLTVVEPMAHEPRQIPEIQQALITGLYSIHLKNGRECQVLYGRQRYDFQEGTLMFLCPGQVVAPIETSQDPEDVDWHGWSLLFHPDLLRGSSLADKIHEYSFFAYDSREALHLSQPERQTLTDIVELLKGECQQPLDDHSAGVLLSYIELLLNHCKRFYARQFSTRSEASNDAVVRFEAHLREYFATLPTGKLPTVKACAKAVGYSPNYLSDLLKKETGQSAQEHIHFHLIERAKDLLLGTQEPVYRVAHALGFEHPQHFSKLFKNKTGLSPSAYRSP